ncbi:MAG: fused MFS/spermidine synthase [Nitrospinae bacterium]|nr:fused MFS/spermidine synthase [Nitrospinota bacterium]
MGNTHYSIATVLTAFMGGLALGSYLGGGTVDRKSEPLLVYAALEAAIGVYCLLAPAIIHGASPLFQWIYLHYQNAYAQASFFRFLVCGSILLVPAAFMGATLPVLGKFVSEDAEFVGKDVGGLYAINTFGAALGAWASAFVFMRLWGVGTTIRLAAFANLAIAGIVWMFFRGRRLAYAGGPEPETPERQEAVAGEIPLVLFCFGVSGLSAMIYQVAWNRIFSLVLGSSVYAFSLILTTFIVGLALGTAVFSRICHRFRDLLKTFGVLQMSIGVSALLALPFLGQVPFFNQWVYRNWKPEFAAVQWSNFLVILALLFVPTFLMGAQFPIVVKLAARRLSTLGRHVGKVYASNTIGAIFGSFLGGFVLIPWLGVQNAILCAILLNAVFGVALLCFCPGLSANAKLYVLPLALAACAWGGAAVPSWDKAVISSGSYMPYRIGDLDAAVEKKNKILFYKEGIHTTVTAELAITGNIFLRVNGKTDASLASDMRTQLLSGYLPLMLHRNPQSALVIGQGSGITLGAAEQFPLKAIDLVEISPEVIEGSRYFSPFNHRALDDKRLRLIVEDGRNHVALGGGTYDVIISEPSNPWISGVGALFTRDFFEMARDRLNPGGIMCIWVHTNMSPENFKSVAKTFGMAFPFVAMWESIVGDDYLLIGSAERPRLPFEATEAFLADPEKGRDLRRIGIHSARDLMSLMIMDRDGLLRFAGDAPIHTDDNALLEFGAPEYIYKDERGVLVRQIAPFVRIDPEIVRFDSLAPENQKRALDEILSARRSESQVAEIKRNARIDRLLDEALEEFRRGDYDKALERYKEVLDLDPEHVLTYLNMGNTHMARQETAAAETAYKKALEINPHYLFGDVALAKLYISTGQAGKAAAHLQQVVARQPADKEVRLYLGLAYAAEKDAVRAIGEWEKALEIDAKFALAHYFLGIHYREEKPSLAKRRLETFLDLSRDEPDSQKLIANAQTLLNRL